MVQGKEHNRLDVLWNNLATIYPSPMTVTIAYLGPEGTYSQLAALAYSLELERRTSQSVVLQDFPSIPQALEATTDGITTLTLVPVENSTEGSVRTTLDTLWALGTLRIHHALVMPIRHACLSQAQSLSDVQAIYSHPQALSQCQHWLAHHLPQAKLAATNSTTEALSHLSDSTTIAAIASEWAGQLYNLPVLAHDINDHQDNCTKFWVLRREDTAQLADQGHYTSLAFSLPVNAPGCLLKPLQIFAHYGINLSRIESRPSKRSLGDYLFFVDLEIDAVSDRGQQALAELLPCTETLINFGSYDLMAVNHTLETAKQKYMDLQSHDITPKLL